ncbi:MAG: bifunctional 3,4-dihydroxy-2-butanone-4-phosphate synthase/GTP cyclohydrolase II [Bacillota bacterium]|nr:bifunctional 3,4-dihydroxy-2-butanone-4-phosphate synthase/GTP cyclohydrolase II [Bacillota bacterium]
MEVKFNKVEEAIEDIRQGKMIVVVDDEDRENEGDLIIAAEKATPEAINFMAKYARGLICVPMEKSRLAELQIGQMVQKNSDYFGTAFTVSVDAVGTTTGISPFERAFTVSRLIDKAAKPEDFLRPGHMFPLEAKEGGVLVRTGHTEAAVDLAKLAGLFPAGVICEITNDDGTMARVPQLMEFVKEHGLKMITVQDLVEYRKEKVVKRAAEVNLPTKYGNFKAVGFENEITGEHHVAIVKGDISTDEPVLVRVHSECLTGDVLHSLRCDCGEQLEAALKRIEEEGRGILLYMRQEGRGIGLINKLKAYELQEKGMDTVEANAALGFPADMREYSAAAQMLKDLGVDKIRLMTNNPTKIESIHNYGIEIVERVPVFMGHVKENEAYLRTKKEKMGHLIEL